MTSPESPTTDNGSRLAGLRYEGLDEAQRAVWDAVTNGRRGSAADLVTDGALIGPFNALLYSPTVGARITSLGEALRFESSLDPALREVAILTAGARWRSEFEFWAHSRIGAGVGLSAETIEAIARRDPPADDPPGTRVVWRLAESLLTDGHPDTGGYDQAVQLLGEAGVVELVALVGYYTTISLTLNTFDVQLPDGATPRWR
jgi:4-carboxymuconolactone decarboxylase